MAKSMNKKAIVIPYFGKLPSYFKAWLISANNNDDIDFIIITDDNRIYQYKLNSNIKIFITNFSNFKAKFQKYVDFKISLEYPYKICDYRPMYGLALSDILKSYDFWGFGDFDVILGDIRKFIRPEIFKNYDRIYNYGALSFYKNTKKMNYLFKRKVSYSDCLSYDYVYKTNFSLYFDEMGGHKYGFGQSTVAIREKDIDLYCNNDCADVKPTYFNFELYNSNDKYDFFEYDKGKVWGIKDGKRMKEYVYLHFQKRRIKVDDVLNINHFYIGPTIISSNRDKIERSFKNKKIESEFKKENKKLKSKKFSSFVKKNAIKYIINVRLGRINKNGTN